MKACLSCGKPADVEIETRFIALTALGEQMCEKIARHGEVSQYACESCLMKTGEALERGDFVEDAEKET